MLVSRQGIHVGVPRHARVALAPQLGLELGDDIVEHRLQDAAALRAVFLHNLVVQPPAAGHHQRGRMREHAAEPGLRKCKGELFTQPIFCSEELSVVIRVLVFHEEMHHRLHFTQRRVADNVCDEHQIY